MPRRAGVRPREVELSDQNPVAPSVVEFPASPALIDVALDELESVYAFIFSRVGNRADAEDLTQQVAMKAIPRLREGAAPASIRAYLFATARSALAQFWSQRLGALEYELAEDLPSLTPPRRGSEESADRLDRILSRLPVNYRRVLELRFLRGYSLKEVAAATGGTVGSVKVMQLRALRAAARVGFDA